MKVNEVSTPLDLTILEWAKPENFDFAIHTISTKTIKCI